MSEPIHLLKQYFGHASFREGQRELARQQHMPAYMILSNATLTDMAQKRPHTREELLRVCGVGEVKAQRYGRIS